MRRVPRAFVSTLMFSMLVFDVHVPPNSTSLFFSVAVENQHLVNQSASEFYFSNQSYSKIRQVELRQQGNSNEKGGNCNWKVVLTVDLVTRTGK